MKGVARDTEVTGESDLITGVAAERCVFVTVCMCCLAAAWDRECAVVVDTIVALCTGGLSFGLLVV